MEKTIKEFLKLEKPSKRILYELIDRIELEEYKNIYIYFNFSELNIINESLNKKYIIRTRPTSQAKPVGEVPRTLLLTQ